MMYKPAIPPPDPDTRAPKFKLPKLSCDAHCHIFRPCSKYPYARDRSYLVDNPARLFEFDR